MKTFAIQIGDILREFVQIMQAYLPRVLAAFVLLILGWLISRLLMSVAFRSVTRFSHWGVMETGLKDSRINDITPKAVALVVFWFSFLLFIASAVHLIGLPVVTGSLNRLAAYLPHLLAAVLVVSAGIVLGNLVRSAVHKIARSAEISHAGSLGEGARITVLVIAVMIALGQAGIESTVLVVAFGLVLGGIIGGMALAFGFGARTAVSNLIAARNARRVYRNGQQIKIGTIQGSIVQISAGAVIIQTNEGRTQVPARVFEEETIVLLDEKD